MGKLVQNCGGLIKQHSISQVKGLKNVDRKKYSLLKYYDISNSVNKPKLKNKKRVYIVAGEHSRELISVDMMFNFIQDLCKNRNGRAK